MMKISHIQTHLGFNREAGSELVIFFRGEPLRLNEFISIYQHSRMFPTPESGWRPLTKSSLDRVRRAQEKLQTEPRVIYG